MSPVSNALEQNRVALAGLWLYHCCRLTIVAVFLWSGLTKMLHPSDFAAIIAAYGLLPEALVFPAAIGLIVVELVAATGLLFEKNGSLLLITLQLLLFVAVLSYGIYLGLDIDCGCLDRMTQRRKPSTICAVLYARYSAVACRCLSIFWRYVSKSKPRPLFC